MKAVLCYFPVLLLLFHLLYGCLHTTAADMPVFRKHHDAPLSAKAPSQATDVGGNAKTTNGSSTKQSKPLFRDDFEYDVPRTAKNADDIFRAHGWSDAKANNTRYQRGAGFLFTKFDPELKSRVLVMESVPSQAPTLPGFRVGQTDYYVKYGGMDSPLTTIPANVWIQFLTYATPESRFPWRHKVLYPCRGTYPCSRRDGRTDYVWLFMWGSGGYETVEAPAGGRFLALHGWHADFRGAAEYPTNQQKLFQNLKRIPLLAGRWYQVRIHIDISKEQGVYEAWIREKDKPWEKVAEWIGGVTKDFFWPIPAEERVGLRVLAMPTTVDGPDDSTTYMDQFVLAASVNDLP